MKKVLFITSLLLALLILASCNDTKYEPIESTEEEARTIYTISADGEKYEIKYELYRMLFLDNKARVDGGDSSVWTSPEKDSYIAQIEKLILEEAADIYATLHLAKKLGLDPYSKKVEEQISEYVRISVEGNGADVTGHGSYENFLASLKARNMNYSVHALILRYAIAYDMLTEYYGGTTDAVLGEIAGEFKYTKSDVEEYYYGTDSARVLQLFFSAEVKSRADMENYRTAIVEKSESALEVAYYIIAKCPISLATDIIDDDAISGVMVGAHELDDKFSDYTAEALSLSAGEVSNIIEATTDGKYYYILYGLEKSSEHFEKFYESVEKSFIEHSLGERLDGVQRALEESAEKGDSYSNISHADISMNR